MNTDEKIGYMIGCLQVAKDEMNHMAECTGMPNKSLVTDNLRNVARIAFKLAREIDHER